MKLTYMSSLEELCEQRLLERVRLPARLDIISQRRLYANQRVVKYMKNKLKRVETDGYIPGAISPWEQVTQRIKEYIRGDNPENWMIPKLLHPQSEGVWEIRTADMRLFGWFHRRSDFVMTSIETKLACQSISGLYHGHIRQAITDRDSLELDEPKFIQGDVQDVF